MATFWLKFADFTAEVDSLGSTLTQLKFKARNLIEPRPIRSRYHGALLAPWPNRIANGRYSYQDKIYELDKNESARNNALHGLVDSLDWEVVEAREDFIQLKVKLNSSAGYPSVLLLFSTFSLSSEGLMWKVDCKNIGEKVAPFGISIHPYLVTGSLTSVDDFYLKFASSSYLEVDSERLLPFEIRDVESRNFNFSQRKRIGDLFIDHAFLVDPSNKYPRIEVTDENGVGAFIEYDENARWIQIHTADREGGEDARRCLAVEPMSCAPDAFNSGEDLIHHEPGSHFSMSWLIGAIN